MNLFIDPKERENNRTINKAMYPYIGGWFFVLFVIMIILIIIVPIILITYA